MKITNYEGLPDAIVRAVSNDPYTKGDADYSVSELVSPARKLALTKKHWEDLEEDVTDRVWALFGKAVHHIAEMANTEGVAERRLFHLVRGKKISGAQDHYHPQKRLLSDYKTASVFKLKFKDFKDWEEQQNCYAQLLRWNGDKVDKLQIIAFCKDWRGGEAKQAALKNEYYPKKAEVVDLPLWPEPVAIGFIEDRVKAHEAAKNALPLCTAEERWARPSTWAIKKTGAAKAVWGHANYAVESFAKAALQTLGPGHYIEHRPGVNTRCESYCSASKFCSQFKELGP